jgi:hypothetical protein
LVTDLEFSSRKQRAQQLRARGPRVVFDKAAVDRTEPEVVQDDNAVVVNEETKASATA